MRLDQKKKGKKAGELQNIRIRIAFYSHLVHRFWECERANPIVGHRKDSRVESTQKPSLQINWSLGERCSLGYWIEFAGNAKLEVMGMRRESMSGKGTGMG